METSTDGLVGARLEGRYDVLRLIATGGMATVWEAHDVRLDRPVAVKVLRPELAADPSFVDRFRREATSAARLAHPHVVAVHDQGGGEHGVPVFLVMELVRGMTLRDLLAQRGVLGAAEALDVLEPVASALAAAHAVGLVHRDVKPENVLLGDDGRVRVADFGLARAVETSSATAAAGLLIGTAAYLAPEQVRDGSAGPASDVYAAGVVLYEMVTGEVPHGGETPLSVAYQHLHADVAVPSDTRPGVPAAVDALVAAATAREVARRIPDGASLLAAARHARRELGPVSHATSVMPAPVHETVALQRRQPEAPQRPQRPQRPRRRRRLLLVLALVLLLSAGAAAGGWWLAAGRWTHAPRVVGATEVAARAAAQQAHVRLQLAPAVYDDAVSKGSVARQEPAPGRRITRDHALVVRLSLGPQLFAVPAIKAGTSPAAAKAQLQAAHLEVGPTVSRYDAAVAAGGLLTTDPAPGSPLKAGSPVTLVTSKGPAPTPVPDVTGRPQAQAQRTLTDAGFTVTLTQASSETVAEGAVISQDPAAGSPQVPRTAVTLTVSTGLPVVEVPSVVGLALADARAALARVGLKETELSFGRNAERVADQNPGAGTKVRKGTTVQLIVIR